MNSPEVQATCVAGDLLEASWMKSAIRVLLILFGAFLCSARAVSLSDCLNAPDLNWTTGGQSPWVPQTVSSHDGVDSAQSGAIS